MSAIVDIVLWVFIIGIVLLATFYYRRKDK